MIRKIIQINEEKCDGCGLCVGACHEAAIGLSDGKARLLRDDYCDGLGDCLPACPVNAISFTEREALPYDEEAVLKNTALKKASEQTLPCGCPSSAAREICTSGYENEEVKSLNVLPSRLSQWPIQIKLAAVDAAYFDGAHILIAADCTAFAYGNFHEEFIKGKKTLIGCPKLDDVNYTDKLTQIAALNDIKSITVVRMEVPCCSGIEYAAANALIASKKSVPFKIITVSSGGEIVSVK